MFGHEDKGVQFESSLRAIAIESLEKESYVRFDDEEPAALPGRKRHEICPVWIEERVGFKGRTSAAEAALFAD